MAGKHRQALRVIPYLRRMKLCNPYDVEMTNRAPFDQPSDGYLKVGYPRTLAA